MTLTVGDIVGAGDIGVGFATATVTSITIATTATASATSPQTNPRRRRSGCVSTSILRGERRRIHGFWLDDQFRLGFLEPLQLVGVAVGFHVLGMTPRCR